MFYNTASLALDRILLKRETVKSVILRHKKDVKLLYKVICQTLKYKQVIETILQSAQLGLKIKHSLLLLLVHDLLFGKLLPCGKPLIINHKTRLEAELAKLKIKRGCSTNQELLPDNAHFVLPRHVRLNPLLTNTFDFLDHFDSYSLTSVLSSKRTIQMDQHVPNLFIFPPSTDFHSDAFLLEGKIILQDKASCFPAIVLNPPAGSVVIDACAAPGNKTSHLSAIMGNSGTIYAFDKDKKRLNTLVSLTTRAGCTNIKPIHSSFLDIDPQSETYSCVEYILLDPSCSGSGIIGRMDHLLEEVEDNSARLDALSLFQKQAILHAFSFPNVKRVVYSTCSKFKEENENVVEHVLETNKQFFLQKALPEWPHRGLGVHGDYLVRTEPYRDQCIGFFVALFERK